jgi:hypothetical protein
VGLYLHSRKSGEEENEATEETESLPEASPQSLASFEGTESGGGLQALGVAGPTPQATVPVEAPFVPEGLTDVVSGQGDTIQTLSNGVLESAVSSNELASILAQREPNREVIREKMVGHPAKRKPHHTAPRKTPQQKRKVKKHSAPKKHKKRH